MVTLEQCRIVLGQTADSISDEDLEQIRAGLYLLARITLQTAGAMKKQSFFQKLSWVPEEDHLAIVERAAILEHDGGLSKDEAEKAAFENYINSKIPGNKNA